MKLLLSLLLLLVSSCGTKATHTDSKVARLSTDQDPTTFDPKEARDLITLNFLGLLYEGLMRQDAFGVLEPAVAKSVEISEDGLTYTFHLKETNWSNGDPVTADDFVVSWNAVIERKVAAPYGYLLGTVDHVVGSDPHTLIVTLNKPTPTFLEITSMPVTYPMHRDGAFNGPYKLAQFSQQDRIVLEKNRAFRLSDRLPYDKIVTYTVKEGSAVALFEQGEIDWAGSPLGTIPLDFIEPYQKSPHLHFADSASTILLRLNTAHEPLDSPQVRHLLSESIDRQALVTHVRKGAGVPANELVPRSCWNSYPERALNSLNESHLDSPKEITLSYPNTELYHRLAQVLQQQWKEQLGLHITLNRLEAKSLSQNLESGQYDIALGSWYADFLDPSNFLEIFKTKDRGTNNTSWENPSFISLLTESETCTKVDERQALLSKAESILLEDMPIIPLYHSSYIYLKRDQLEGISVNPLGRLCVY